MSLLVYWTRQTLVTSRCSIYSPILTNASLVYEDTVYLFCGIKVGFLCLYLVSGIDNESSQLSLASVSVYIYVYIRSWLTSLQSLGDVVCNKVLNLVSFHLYQHSYSVFCYFPFYMFNESSISWSTHISSRSMHF